MGIDVALETRSLITVQNEEESNYQVERTVGIFASEGPDAGWDAILMRAGQRPPRWVTPHQRGTRRNRRKYRSKPRKVEKRRVALFKPDSMGRG